MHKARHLKQGEIKSNEEKGINIWYSQITQSHGSRSKQQSITYCKHMATLMDSVSYAPSTMQTKTSGGSSETYAHGNLDNSPSTSTVE
jgi:hypothetical protein